jgi:hypothetical protein
MNHSPITYTFSNREGRQLYSGRNLLAQIILQTLLVACVLLTPALASQSPFDIVDTWVEDGFLFHVEFDTQPTNAQCELDGEGVIEFKVTYRAQGSSGIKSVFGLAIWYPNSNTEERVETHGRAIGSQAVCSTFSPCILQAVNIVKTYCPVTNDPLFTW